MASVKFSRMNGTVASRPDRDGAGRNYVGIKKGSNVGNLVGCILKAKNIPRDDAAKQMGITRGVLDNCIDKGLVTASNVDRIKYWAGRFLEVRASA